MVESDIFNELLKPSKSDINYPDHHSLITENRAEKLELLIHLITHDSPSIVVCGPKGIGKTTLLNALQGQQFPSLKYCFVTGSPELDIEALRQALPQQTTPAFHKIVLIIDIAGVLAPGLITQIIQYVTGEAKLCVIFALTLDELYIKNSTDPLIDECHIIEIPPMTEKQCGEYLQYLATKPSAYLSANELYDDAVLAIYRKTHGIPGNIIAALPELIPIKKHDRTLVILIAAVIILVGLTLGIQWLTQTKPFLSWHFTEQTQTTP